MRAVVQRVTRASVTVDGAVVGEIGPGLVVLIGVEREDSEGAAAWLARKIVGLRIFPGGDGAAERPVRETGGAVLAVSQFTLLGDCRKGRRPSFSRAAPGPEAKKLYERFCELLADEGVRVATGRFGAMMKVRLVNDGPCTLLLDSPAGAAKRRGRAKYS